MGKSWAEQHPDNVYYMSSCTFCKHYQTYGTHGSYEYCAKEFPVVGAEGQEPPQSLSLQRRLIGCHLFEQNELTISEESYQLLMSHEYYKDTILRKIPKEKLVGDGKIP